ncbi:hypothetical protein DLNHIDIE_01826 [Acidithiobacillus thiooxidans ATCC 19377]|uniref:Uncharacterized protein n=1 Tax=Acidithiobacillus thiooxidans ATCC 19377 TaxID=637390 RepID=A0A543Q6J8_ACITH|nr:hypothetical protein DLNHIDIE_01826 [Acidithiobacillus thiooxidans ATCC 19377]
MCCLCLRLVAAFFLMATCPSAHADEPVATQSFWAGLSTKAKFQGEVVSNLAGAIRGRGKRAVHRWIFLGQ